MINELYSELFKTLRLVFSSFVPLLKLSIIAGFLLGMIIYILHLAKNFFDKNKNL